MCCCKGVLGGEFGGLELSGLPGLVLFRSRLELTEVFRGWTYSALCGNVFENR